MIGKHKHELNKSAERRVIKKSTKKEIKLKIQRIRDLAKKGYNMSKISRELGISPSYVSNICINYKIKTSSKHNPITKDDIDHIKRLASKYTLKEVVDKSNLSRNKIRGIMIDNNIKAKSTRAGRPSDLTIEADIKKSKDLSKMDVFEVSKLILKDKGYKNSAEYIAENGYIAFQNNIKPLVDKKMDSIKQSNNK